MFFFLIGLYNLFLIVCLHTVYKFYFLFLLLDKVFLCNACNLHTVVCFQKLISDTIN